MTTTPPLPEPAPGLLMLKDGPSWTGARSRRTGYAVHSPATGALVLMDPPPLGEGACAQLEALGPPTIVLLTVTWHLRGGEAHRRRWGCPILIPEAGLATAETAVDGTFRVGDVLWDAVEVLQPLTEFGWPEEVVLRLRLPPAAGAGAPPKRVLYVGDAVCGGRDDIGLPEGEVGQYTLLGPSPEEVGRLVPDLPAAHRALQGLLRLGFDALAFGHGSPVVRDSHAALRRFLARRDVWGELAAADA
jgi:hypothetical protein